MIVVVVAVLVEEKKEGFKMNASLDLANASDNATDAAIMAPHALLSPPAPSVPPPCDDFYPGGHCLPEMLSNEERFLAIMSIILACAVCALIVLVMVMSALIHKLSVVWIKSLTRQAQTEPSDDPRKGLLQETKSSLRDTTQSKAEGKKKKTSFSEDTSCAPARDVDEEDL